MYTVVHVNIDLLKSVLSVPTKTGQEHLMVQWLRTYFSLKGLTAVVDKANNVYVTKGISNAFPCLVAHTDSVHTLEVICVEEDQDDADALAAFDTRGLQTGLGGDDKAGIFICLSLIDRLENVKAVFFMGEEHGCIGARQRNGKFFADVAYAIEFDSPCQDIMTFTCNGVELFDLESKFFETIYPLLMSHGVNKWQHHPFTDVSVLKKDFDFPCLNLPGGYFHMHSRTEWVSKSAVANSIELGAAIILSLGENKHNFGYYPAKRSYPKSPVAITGLETHD